MIVLVILGHVLVTIISIIFVLALMLLFIPFIYLSYGSANNANGGATAELKWLFSAVGMKLAFRTGLPFIYELRIGFLHFRPNFHRGKEKVGEGSIDKEKKREKGRFTKEKLMIVLKSIKRILKRYKPRRLMIDAIIGFDDAYYTGLMCAGLSSLSPLISSAGSEVRIIPEFNEAVFEGCYKTEGRVVVFFIAWEGLRIFFSKPFRINR